MDQRAYLLFKSIVTHVIIAGVLRPSSSFASFEAFLCLTPTSKEYTISTQCRMDHRAYWLFKSIVTYVIVAGVLRP